MNNTTDNINLICNLNCWANQPIIERLSGGMTNENFLIHDGNDKYVVRLGEDNYEHLILRANELAASRAANEIGLAPQIIYSEPGVLVTRFIDGHVFCENDVLKTQNLFRVLSLIKRFHRDMTTQFRGYPVLFWVFSVIRHYEHVLRVGRSEHFHRLPDFLDIAHSLELAVGPVNLVYCHNDLLAANFIDDGKKIWLIDYDYAGFNTPLFDLANLASNNGFSADDEKQMLSDYFESDVIHGLWKSYRAIKCASLLRETMWSMVSEIHSKIDFDYGQYTQQNLAKFENQYQEYQHEFVET